MENEPTYEEVFTKDLDLVETVFDSTGLIVEGENGKKPLTVDGKSLTSDILSAFYNRNTYNRLYEYNGNLYIRYRDMESGDLVLTPTDSKTFRICMTRFYYHYMGETVKAMELERLLLNISVLPIQKIELHSRVCQIEDAFFFDLSNPVGEVVKITEAGWEIVVPDSPLFLPATHLLPAIRPIQPKNSLDYFNRLWKLINTDRQFKLLQKVAFVLSFTPIRPQPISVVYGEHGSAKSFFSKIWKRLVDPSHSDATSLPDMPKDVIHLLGANWFVAFDNVSGIKQKISDVLCMGSTGGTQQQRKLYTDGETYSRDLSSVIVLNGINISVNQPDLMRRSLIFHCDFIPTEKRRSEEDIYMELSLIEGKVMGAVFSMISKAMINVSKYRDMENLPIMADFAIWGSAISEALEEEEGVFLATYKRNSGKQSSEVLSGDNVGSILLGLLEAAPFKTIERKTGPEERWTLTKRELLSRITREAEMISEQMVRGPHWPKNLQSFARKMNRLRPTLREIGYEFEELRMMMDGARTQMYSWIKRGPLLKQVFESCQRSSNKGPFAILFWRIENRNRSKGIKEGQVAGLLADIEGEMNK